MTTQKLLVALALCCASSLAHAQIYAVHFPDAKTAARYKSHLVVLDGREVLLGEARSGLVYDPATGRTTYPNNARFELFVPDPANPGAVPYRLEGSERVPTNRRQVVGVQGAHVARLVTLMPHQSLAGLAVEYRERQDLVSELGRARDAAPRGSSEWFAEHHRMVAAQERLRSWLASTAFPDAARKLDGEIQRQRKVVQSEAASARLQRALSAIRAVETPELLLEASKEITGGSLRFGVMESMHIRIVYIEEVGEQRVRELLELGERVIAGFRADCIDPYVGAEFEDHVPERLFSEFWLGPTEPTHRERFFTEYYGQSWGVNKEERMKMSGQRARLLKAPEHLDYYRVDEQTDYEGLLVHGLGHHLVAVHYARNVHGWPPDWITEGCALYLSLEYLGRNTVTCKAFAPPDRYVRQQREQRPELTVQLGTRGYFQGLALEHGSSLDRLAMTRLYDMEDGDLAKAWSIFDHLVRAEGRRGQELLREACHHASKPETFMAEWRAAAERLWGITGQDVFRHIDQAWRERATASLELPDPRRR